MVDPNLTKEIRNLLLQKRSYKYRMNIMTLEEKQAKYQALCRAMQTGVAYELEKNSSQEHPNIFV